MPNPMQCSYALLLIIVGVSSTYILQTMLSLLLNTIPTLAWTAGAVTTDGSASTLTFENAPAATNAIENGLVGKVDLRWHAPKQWHVNNLTSAIHGTDTYGFVFNSSENPTGVPYGTYNWCNMPHVRQQEYPVPDSQYELKYVELIHRHHKRTPYASNTFPVEAYSWECSDEGLFFYGQPLKPAGNLSASTYWDVYTSPNNPFAPQGFNGTCQFPQITRGGLDDSWQHGRDLYGVYHDLLHFLPSDIPNPAVKYRVSNNVITSQVAGMLINGMYGVTDKSYPLLVQPDSIDSLEPTYSCPSASNEYAAYGVGGSNPNWTAHLTESMPLFQELDAISGVSPDASDWHVSWDHYFDNLSSRLCHAKSLPCNVSEKNNCVTPSQAAEVFRLGEYEYSYIYRDAPQSLNASVASFGVWVAELSAHFRSVVAGKAGAGTSGEIYRHNVAHDGSVSRLLSILQIEKMVWPGMGAEVVFELFKAKHNGKYFVRILWGGQVLRSSNPSLGSVDMLPVETILAYFDGLVGVHASLIPGLCGV